LKATAGMRLLPLTVQQEILSSIRLYLSTSGFYFKSEWAQVISGVQEGIFGWITVNYLLHDLETSENETFGALDMGGASTQITYYTKPPILQNSFNLTFNPELEYTLYTYSFLNYGLDEAQSRVIQEAITHSSSIIHPCFPVGYSMNVTISSMIYTVIGSGDYADCQQLILQFMNLSVPCLVPSCSMNGVYQPSIPPNMNFFAFSGYAYIYAMFNLSTNASLSELEKNAKYYCGLTWDEIQQEYSWSSNPGFLNVQCFRSTYIYSVLVNGYGLNPNKQNIQFMVVLDNIEIGWTVGAMLFEADQLPFSYCSFLSDCNDCSKFLKCGWCASSQKCLSGDNHGDYNNQCHASDWFYDDCVVPGSDTFSAVTVALIVVLSIISVAIVVIFGVYFYKQWRGRRIPYQSLPNQ